MRSHSSFTCLSGDGLPDVPIQLDHDGVHHALRLMLSVLYKTFQSSEHSGVVAGKVRFELGHYLV